MTRRHGPAPVPKAAAAGHAPSRCRAGGARASTGRREFAAWPQQAPASRCQPPPPSRSPRSAPRAPWSRPRTRGRTRSRWPRPSAAGSRAPWQGAPSRPSPPRAPAAADRPPAASAAAPCSAPARSAWDHHHAPAAHRAPSCRRACCARGPADPASLPPRPRTSPQTACQSMPCPCGVAATAADPHSASRPHAAAPTRSRASRSPATPPRSSARRRHRGATAACRTRWATSPEAAWHRDRPPWRPRGSACVAAAAPHAASRKRHRFRLATGSCPPPHRSCTTPPPHPRAAETRPS